MPRYFSPITVSELQAKIDKHATGHHDVVRALQDVLTKDLKVHFDCENTYCGKAHWKGSEKVLGYQTLKSGLTFLGCAGGGDWEFPVVFICYWDGKKLRGYIPTEGNRYNTDTMWAFGNPDESGDPDADSKNIQKRWYPDYNAAADDDPDEPHFYVDHVPEFDFKEMIKDIEARILPQGSPAVKIPAPTKPAKKNQLTALAVKPAKICLNFNNFVELEAAIARLSPKEKKGPVVFYDGDDKLIHLGYLEIADEDTTVMVTSGDSVSRGYPYLW